MRLTIALLGFELDVTLGPAEAATNEPERPAISTEVGTVVGFTANIAPQWDDQGSLHTLDPGEDGEDRRRS